MRWRICLFGAIIVGAGLFGGAALGADLGYLTISDPDDVRQATRIFNIAHYRQDDRFLVSATAEQMREWVQLGGRFDLVATDVDAGKAVLVYELREPDRQTPVVAAAGAALALGDGVTLLPLSAIPAFDLQQQGIKSQSLTELRIPFFALPRISIPTALADVYPSDSVAALISTDSLMAYIRKLESYRTRYLTTDSGRAARDWLVTKFQDWGYADADIQPFYAGGWGWQYNVRATKLGTAEPDKVIVIGGHYDSYSGDAQFRAPGADDDASGVAVTLELARIFRNIPLRKTIIFMPFGAEEMGLFGSSFAAEQFQLAGTNLEVMFNYDMVAYEPFTNWVLNLQAGRNAAYQQMMVAAAARLTDIQTAPAAVSQNSDHAPFNVRGYPIVFAIEGHFNTPNYHTIHDSSTKLNPPFLTDVARMGAATTAIVADAPSITPIDSIVDQGDGQSLQVFWSSCPPDYQFTVLVGTTPGVYTSQYPVAVGTCSYLVDGLAEDQLYYFALRPQILGGYSAAYLFEDTARSLVYPRAPRRIDVRPDLMSIHLSWGSNREADIDHYEIYRKTESEQEFTLLVPSITATAYSDNAVEHWTRYDYQLVAVDRAGHRSPGSVVVHSMPASFDRGVLVVNEISPENMTVPTPEHFDAWLDTVMPGQSFGLTELLDINAGLRRDLAGQYSSIFWIDDDVGTKVLQYNQDSLRWYGGYQGNVLLTGFQTIQFFPGSMTDGNFLHDQFGLDGYSVKPQFEFVGAHGEDGWPSLANDTLRGFPAMGWIPELTPGPGVEVIYRYDSRFNSALEGVPVGLAYSGPHGKRVLLAFPIFYMQPNHVRAFFTAARAWFGEPGTVAPGDLDGSGDVDMTDVIALVDFVFFNVLPLAGYDAVDMDGDCRIDPSDLQYLVDFIFFAGPRPLPSCVP